ncbi:3-oxoadipate enol-lactonase, partial [Collimonas sp. OK607]|uniref:alpha/beta hydrolase n=1 Tax=Collimonas sp. OK607 TaxID=1798194 RepID=UPI0008EEB3E6
AHFCGISMGGMIGQWLGIHAPERLKKLVVANSAAKIGAAEAWINRAKAVRADGLDAIADSAASRWFSPSFVKSGSSIVSELVAHLRSENAEGYASCCEALADADLRGEIHSIPNPTLIIAGQYDPVTTESDAVSMHQEIKDSKMVVLPASHISNVEAEKLFTRALSDFLTV